MRIVVTDGYTLNPGDNPWDEVANLGDFAVYDRTPDDQIIERTRDADVLVINKTPLSATTLGLLPKLKLIAVSATGYNVVDVAAARARGIPVSNVPEYGTDSVSQFVFALLLELCHRVAVHDGAVKAGQWSQAPDFSFWLTPLVELAGKRMGVIGFGRIGRRVGEIAHAFGMEVLAADVVTTSVPGYQPFAWRSVREVFAQADVVSLHCPQTTENTQMVNRDLLRLMKKTAFFINAARGGLVVDADLAWALDEGLLAGAALDVVSSEPIKPDNPLLGARNCIITPHMAWAALAARKRLMATTAANIASFMAGTPINLVN